MLTESALDGFTGTEGYHRWSILFRRHVLTDGAKYLADHGGANGAYWLMDAIASHIINPAMRKDERLRDMQFWFLRKGTTKDSVVLTCWADTGEGETAKITQKIEYSDFFANFDGDELKLYVQPLDETTYVIMLPSEY